MQIDEVSCKYVRVVSHANQVIAFFSRETSPGSGQFGIGYSLMTARSGNPDTDASWTDFCPLLFPRQISTVGRAVVAVDFDGEVPVADEPFQVVSDGGYLYVFRQSKDANIYVDRFVLDETTGRISNAWQVRFRRSGKVDIPLDRRDTFGSTDMNGERFVEPTTQLGFLTSVADGAFAVTLVPAELPSLSRWQFFLRKPDTGELESYSILRSANGLFDLSDRIDEEDGIRPEQTFALLSRDREPLPVSSGPAVLLYYQQEWLPQADGGIALQKREARVMLAAAAGSDKRIAIADFGVAKDATLARGPAELIVGSAPAPATAMEISATCPVYADLPPVQVAGPYTVECWLAPVSPGTGRTPGIILSSASGPMTLALVDEVPVFTANGDAAVTAADPIGTQVWTHLAGTWDGTTAVLYVNGERYDDQADPVSPADAPATGYRVGGPSSISARIAQLRIWQRARSQDEILTTMCVTVTSADPGWADLNGYWPMDAPPGAARFTTVLNTSRLPGVDGSLHGTRWVPSITPAVSSFAPVSWDDRGLTVATGLLKFVASQSAPWLTEGADSLIHLYATQPPNGAMAAAHLSTVVARSTVRAQWAAADPADHENDETGQVNFVARQTGAQVNARARQPSAVTIALDGMGFVTVTLRGYTGYTERWPKVPQALEPFCAVLNGEAAQQGDDPAQEARSNPIYDYKSVVVTAAGGQLGPIPGPGTGSALFAVLPDELPSNGITALVTATANAPVAFGRVGTDPCWLPAPPLAGLDLSELGQFAEVLSAGAVADYDGPLGADRDMAVEAWLRPVENPVGDPMTVLVFNQPDGAQYLLGIDDKQHPYAVNGSVAARADVALGYESWQHVAASYQSSFGIQLGGERYLDAGNDRSLDTLDAVTAEIWVRLDRLPPAPQTQTAIAKWAPQGGQSWSLEIDSAGRARFTVLQSTATGSIPRTVTSAASLTLGVWHQMAAVYDVAFERQVAIMFATGSYVALPQVALPPRDGVTVAMWLKGVGAFQPSDQVLFMSQDPSQPIIISVGLRDGYPSFEVNDGDQSYSVVSDRLLRNDDWTHLACSYQHDTHLIALLVDGVPMYGGAGEADTGPRSAALVASADLGAEVAYTVGGVGAQQSFVGLINELSLWNRGLSVDEIRQRINQPLAASERGLAGYWPCNDLFGTTVMDLAGTANGRLADGNFTRVDKGQFAQKVFIDGRMEAFERVVDPLIACDTNVTIGSAAFAGYLQGAIGETRLWSTGRMNWQIDYFAQREVEPNPRGLISLWPLETGHGAVAFDAKSDNNAVIRDANLRLTATAVDAMWIRATFKAAWMFYLDGSPVPATAFAPVGSAPVFGDPQATIGILSYRSALVNQFTGLLAELRVWGRQLTGEQVRGLMNRPLDGDEPGLAGYWPVDDGSGDLIADRTGGGANGQWIGDGTPTWGASAAPVGAEPLIIASVPDGLGASVTGLVRRSRWAPGTASYGELELGARGALLPTLKLALGYVDAGDSGLPGDGAASAGAAGAGQLQLQAGRTVGDLDLSYVGQAQLAPTLVGYIEGAPPLPAENLKVYPDEPGSYVGASSVTIDEVGNEVLSYTGSRTLGSDSALSLQAGIGINMDTSAGLGVQQKIYGIELSAGLQAEAEESTGTLAEAQITEETQVTTRKYVETQGTWLPNPYAIDGGVGSIFYPANVGYALVRSGTADVFAMRIRGTGTLIGYTMRPSPDIPEDTNIIMFKIKNSYVKNGTLDGYIGFQPDTTYQRFLQPGEHGSYFKPTEAYALKQLVDRERQQRRARFDVFDAEGLGRRDKAGRPGAIDLAERDRDVANVLLGVAAKGALSSEAWKERLARRNLVNTYVWTADGGLYSEEQQFAAVREESSGGVHSITTRAGAYFELSFNVGPSYSLTALFGSHVMTQATKVSREQWQYLLEAQVLGERYIGLIEEDGDALKYTDKPSPGKVRSYRFMSFYLAPSKRNFDDFTQVVDDEWLAGTGPYAGTYDPDALALRQALSRPNEVWRVLHRVTYVSRTPPLTQRTGESLPSSVRGPDDESITQNALLISELPPASDSATTMAKVSVAADALLAALATNPVWGAKLAENLAAHKRDVMTYMGSYYGIQGVS